jgi:hypothetical protein
MKTYKNPSWDLQLKLLTYRMKRLWDEICTIEKESFQSDYRKESISFLILSVTLSSKRIMLRGGVPSCLSASRIHGG